MTLYFGNYFYSPSRNVIISAPLKCGIESVRYLILCEENIKLKNHDEIWLKFNTNCSLVKI